jgi:hypothetical protein
VGQVSKSISPALSPSPLTPRAETAPIPSTAVRPFSNPTALLPRVSEKATDLAYFDYAILLISKEEVAPPTTTDSIAGDLANNETPNLKS